MTSMQDLLLRLKEEAGSDLHLAAGRVPRMRKKGALEAMERIDAFDDRELRTRMQEITSMEQWEEFEKAAGKGDKAAADFLVTARGADQAAIGKAFKALSDACKGCHKKFREKEE